MTKAKTAIDMRGVTKNYGNNRGITDVSLSVKAGEIFGFLGPNGAGKTTTIRCIMDFIRPSKGTIAVFGSNSHTDSVAIKARVGFLPSDSQLYMRWTGQEHLGLYKKMRGPSDMSDVVNRLGLSLNVQAKHLSTGNKQKLSLLLALYGNPKLLVLDEPTKGLDPILQQEIYTLLNEYKHRGGTVFLSSHNLPEVEKICDSIGVIKEGKIVASETMQSIRDMNIHIISFSTESKINQSDFNLVSTEVLHHSEKHIILKAKGDLSPLMQTIAKYKVKDLEVTHASLEDIFMEFYKD